MVDIEVTYETAAKLHELRKLLEKGAKALAVNIKAFVDAFGPVEVEPGKFLAVIPRESRIALDEKTMRRAGRELGISEAIDALLDWRDAQPRDIEGRLDIYSEATLAEKSEG